MKRRDFLSLTPRTAAALSPTPAPGSTGSSTTSNVEPSSQGGIAPRGIKHGGEFIVGAESVTEGHPDKLADLIADTIVDSVWA